MAEPESHIKGSSRISDGRFYLVTALVGVLTGALGSLFHILADALLGAHDALVAGTPIWQAMLVSALASALMVGLALVLVRRFAPEAAGSGVQEIEGAMAGLRPLRWARVLPVKFVGGVLSIGSGLVVGREGPTIHIGAAIAAAFAQRARFGKVETRGLFAAGAAAGLATAFNAPLAAILFVIEETRQHFPYTFRTYAGVIVAAFFATVVTEDIAGVGPDLAIGAASIAPFHLVAFLLFGALLGVVGYGFNRVLLRALDMVAAANRWRPYVVPVAIAAVIGALTVAAPMVTGGGEALIPEMLTGNFAVLGLLGLCLLRFATTMGSYATGVPGGIFAPILSMATCLGLAFAGLYGLLVPSDGEVANAFVIAGMAGLFASTVRAPLVGIVLAAELTGAFGVLLPVIATAGASHLVAEKLGGRPIYEQLLDRTLRLAHQQPLPQAPDTPIELGWTKRGKRAASGGTDARPRT